jgi:predicted GNAT superfamily acetyltransferase
VTAAVPEIVIRHCRGLDEFNACVELQKEVWGFSDRDLIPVRMFVVADKVGGQIIGGFAGAELVAFSLSVPGMHAARPYLHSHMLAVRDPYRNSGLGRRIKLFQREDALSRGIGLIEWTFDPLEIKNAWFNLERLGAIVRRYTINQYGITSSPLQGFLPTDRCIAEWWLDSERVRAIAAGQPRPQIPVERTIEVPAEIYEWKANEATRQRAHDVLLLNRELFLKAFEQGLAVIGYERNARGDGKFLLGRWSETA